MTGRGASLLLLALGPLLGSNRIGWLFWPSLILVVVAAALVIGDHIAAPGASRLRVVREHTRTLAQGRPNVVRLTIALEGGGRNAGYRATVRDENPPDVPTSVDLQRLRLQVAPQVLEYELTPPTRGERAFGRTVVRVQGPLGLATRQSSVGMPDAVRVDPDLSAIAAFEALARRGQLAELGVRVRRRPGEGTEFERIRDAVPDDPPRSINWRATARTGRLMASELVPERAQPVIVCVDHGRLMGVGAGSMTKLDHAIGAALLLLWVALRTGDRAGLLTFADHISGWVPPQSGRRQLIPVLEALRPLQAATVEADYDQAFASLGRRWTRRALIIVFTDVIDPDQARRLIAQCAHLRRRHVPMVVTVRDPAMDAAAEGWPADVGEVYARAVAAGMLAERARTLRRLRGSGVDTLDADVRTLAPRLVNRYLEIKARARL